MAVKKKKKKAVKKGGAAKPRPTAKKTTKPTPKKKAKRDPLKGLFVVSVALDAETIAKGIRAEHFGDPVLPGQTYYADHPSAPTFRSILPSDEVSPRFMSDKKTAEEIVTKFKNETLPGDYTDLIQVVPAREVFALSYHVDKDEFGLPIIVSKLRFKGSVGENTLRNAMHHAQTLFREEIAFHKSEIEGYLGAIKGEKEEIKHVEKTLARAKKEWARI